MRPTTEWDSLPRFINGNASDDRAFVVHLHWPRFVAEIFEDDSCVVGKPLWVDEPEGLSAADLAQLMREAGDFYTAEADRE